VHVLAQSVRLSVIKASRALPVLPCKFRTDDCLCARLSIAATTTFGLNMKIFYIRVQHWTTMHIFLKSSHQEGSTIENWAADSDAFESSRRPSQSKPILFICSDTDNPTFQAILHLSIQRHSRQLRWRRPTPTYYMCPLASL